MLFLLLSILSFLSVLSVKDIGSNHTADVIDVYSFSDLEADRHEGGSIYNIKSIIDLKGQTIQLNQSSILRFDGGCIKNGVLKGLDTYIDAGPYTIFDSSINLDGTWINTTSYVEWFKPTDDNALIINKLLKSIGTVRLIGGKKYELYSSIEMPIHSQLIMSEPETSVYIQYEAQNKTHAVLVSNMSNKPHIIVKGSGASIIGGELVMNKEVHLKSEGSFIILDPSAHLSRITIRDIVLNNTQYLDKASGYGIYVYPSTKGWLFDSTIDFLANGFDCAYKSEILNDSSYWSNSLRLSVHSTACKQLISASSIGLDLKYDIQASQTNNEEIQQIPIITLRGCWGMIDGEFHDLGITGYQCNPFNIQNEGKNNVLLSERVYNTIYRGLFGKRKELSVEMIGAANGLVSAEPQSIYEADYINYNYNVLAGAIEGTDYSFAYSGGAKGDSPTTLFIKNSTINQMKMYGGSGALGREYLQIDFKHRQYDYVSGTTTPNLRIHNVGVVFDNPGGVYESLPAAVLFEITDIQGKSGRYLVRNKSIPETVFKSKYSYLLNDNVALLQSYGNSTFYVGHFENLIGGLINPCWKTISIRIIGHNWGSQRNANTPIVIDKIFATSSEDYFENAKLSRNNSFRGINKFDGGMIVETCIHEEKSFNRLSVKEQSLMTGYLIFDTKLGIPLWWNGRAWINSYGEVVP